MSEQPAPSAADGRRLDPQLRRLVLFAGGVVVLIVMGFRIFDDVANVLMTVVFGFFLSLAMEPAVNWLHKKHGWRRGSATGLIMVIMVLFGAMLVLLMIPVLIQGVKAVAEALPTLADSLIRFANDTFGTTISAVEVDSRLREAQGEIAGWAAETAVGAVSSVVGVTFQLFTVLLFTFYFTANAPNIRRAVASLFPRDRQDEVLSVWEAAIEQTGGYFFSRAILAFLNGLAMFAVLAIVGVPFAFPLALVAGIVSQFIPIVGTYIGGALPVLVALADPGLDGAIVVLVWIIIYQQLENYLLSPRISSRTMSLNPAVAFFAALVGGSLGGVLWAFLALPVAAVIQFAASLFIQRHEVITSDLTEAYVPEPKERPSRGEHRSLRERLSSLRRDADDSSGS